MNTTNAGTVAVTLTKKHLNAVKDLTKTNFVENSIVGEDGNDALTKHTIVAFTTVLKRDFGIDLEVNFDTNTGAKR